MEKTARDKKRKVVKKASTKILSVKKSDEPTRLKDIEKRYNLLFRATFEAIIVHDNGTIIDVNETTCKMFGYNRKELIGASVLSLATTDTRDIVLEKVRSNYQKPYEAKGLRKNGSTFYGEISSRSFIENGKQIRVGTVRDISERKRLEAVNTDYRNLIDNSPVGVFIHDEKGNILFVNKRMMSIMGMTRISQLKNKNALAFVLPEFHPVVKKRKKGLAEKNADIPFSELKIKNLKGKIIDVESKPLLVEYEGKNAVLVVCNDLSYQRQIEKELLRIQVAEENNIRLQKEINERKKIQEELIKTQELITLQAERIKTILENSSFMFLTLNRNMNITSFNKNFENFYIRSFGETPQVGESRTNKPFDMPAEKQQQFTDSIKKIFETGQGFSMEVPSKGMWLDTYISPIFDKHKKVSEIAGIAHDITDKKNSEDSLRNSLKEKEILLKEVHHRVKNNMQVISSILNLQSAYVTDIKTQQILKESQSRIKSMALIHESLYQTDNFSKINLAEYLTNLSKNLFHSFVIDPARIKLHISILPVFLNLDYSIPVGLIINELMSNSFKYAFPGNKQGDVWLEITQKNNTLTLTVRDNGVGLPPELDIKNTETLGLQIVNTLVDQINGNMVISSEKGVKFIIKFEHKE